MPARNKSASRNAPPRPDATALPLAHPHAAGIDGGVTIAEDAVHTFTTADFAFTDVENHALSQVRITTLPGNGVIARWIAA